MTWEEFSAARQVLLEDRSGYALRARQRAEDAIAEATRSEISRTR